MPTITPKRIPVLPGFHSTIGMGVFNSVQAVGYGRYIRVDGAYPDQLRADVGVEHFSSLQRVYISISMWTTMRRHWLSSRSC